MALVALEIPKVGLVMENARLVRWLKNVGETVQQGEPLLELETEKSVVEIESTESGRLVEILLQVDQEARVGDRVAWLEVGGQGTATLGRGATSQVTGAPTQASASVNSASPEKARPASVVTGGMESNGRPTGRAVLAPDPSDYHLTSGRSPDTATPGPSRVRSSPVARRLAAQHAVDLRRITGTGPRGRVQLADVRRAIGTQPAPLSSMRRALARSMTLSNATVPQFNVERSVDWTTIQRLRAEFVAELPTAAPRPSVNDFLLQGIARALLSHPALNGTFSGDANSSEASIVAANGTHIGLVVAVENGLLVPVFHDVETVSLAELARRRTATVERALGGKLKRDELEGATFSVSNLGARGPDRFTALINPPQSAILAVGRQRDCVVVSDGGLHVKPMSQLTLTVDHRVADGRLASDFLACLVDILEGETWRLR